LGVIALSALLAATAMLAAAPSRTAAANPVVTELSVSGSPFAANLAPLPTSVQVRLVTSQAAQVAVRVLNGHGHAVRTLQAKSSLVAGTYSWSWNGRNDNGQLVADGKYKVQARVSSNGTKSNVSRSIRKGLPVIFPANPGAIVVVVDPGHGGRFPGAVRDGYMEKDFNLAIGLKLAAMLQNAGVQVVMTRSTDVAVDEPKSDRNGDGILDRYDDDLARNDVANAARADVAVHVHNNASRDPAVYGTKAFLPANRSWTPVARTLADLVVDEVSAALKPYQSVAFAPRNRGAHTGWYYYMGPYDPPFLPRAALMTSVLSESLYVSNPADREALKRDDVRTSIAAGIYVGVARWLNSRQLGIGYELVSGPPPTVDAESAVSYKVRVTNRGNAPSSGWSLQLRSVPGVPLYDGSGALGTLVGSAPVPDGLQPGASVDVTVSGVAPSAAGEWLIKSDVQLPGSTYASAAGIVPLQTPLTTTSTSNQ
jgi:N-acetylmuramoyl-L-alanine amidase